MENEGQMVNLLARKIDVKMAYLCM